MTNMGSPYYPWWLDNLADDVTGEGAAMQGTAQGAEAVRSIVVAARELYEHQEFSFTGDYGENGFLEDYTCQIRGEPTSVVVNSYPQRRRGGPAPGGEPPAAQLGATFRPLDGREVRRAFLLAKLFIASES